MSILLQAQESAWLSGYGERVTEWLRRLTRKPKVRTAVGSNPALDSLVAVRNSSPGQPEPYDGNLVAALGSCGGLMVKHPWPLLEISLSDFRRLTTLNIYTYPPTFIEKLLCLFENWFSLSLQRDEIPFQVFSLLRGSLRFDKLHRPFFRCLQSRILRKVDLHAFVNENTGDIVTLVFLYKEEHEFIQTRSVFLVP